MDITTKNRTELKFFFQKNKIPTEEQFSFLLDAQLNHQEDNIARVAGNPISLQAEGDAISTQNTLDLYARFSDTTPQWTLNLNPRSIPIEPATAVPGLNIMDGTTQDSRLFIQKSNGNVGIGTVEPLDGKLHVKQSGSSSESGITVEGSGTSPSKFIKQYLDGTNARMRTGANNLMFMTNDATRMTIDSAGKVGIGLTIPSMGKLHVKQSSNGSNEGIGVQGTGSDQYLKQYYSAGANIETGNNKLSFRNNSGEWMTVGSNGKIGINHNNPLYGQLHLRQGTLDKDDGITVESPTDPNSYIKHYMSALDKANIETGDNSLILRTNGRDNVTIDRNGWVGIATTTPSMGRIHINQEEEGDDRGLAIEAPGKYLKSYLDDGRANIETGNNSMLFRTNGINRMEIQNDGDILVAGTTPFIFRRYELGAADFLDFTTAYNHSQYAAGIVGYSTGPMSPADGGIYNNLIIMVRGSTNWKIIANTPTDGPNEGAWVIDVLFVRLEMASLIGY